MRFLSDHLFIRSLQGASLETLLDHLKESGLAFSPRQYMNAVNVVCVSVITFFYQLFVTPENTLKAFVNISC